MPVTLLAEAWDADFREKLALMAWGSDRLVSDTNIQFSPIEKGWRRIGRLRLADREGSKSRGADEPIDGRGRLSPIDYPTAWCCIIHPSSFKSQIIPMRPYQGLHRIPECGNIPATGKIQKKSVLWGLHRHYYKDSA